MCKVLGEPGPFLQMINLVSMMLAVPMSVQGPQKGVLEESGLLLSAPEEGASPHWASTLLETPQIAKRSMNRFRECSSFWFQGQSLP
jgi:hypothetical protein